MKPHGTPSEVSPGQLATVISRVVTALPGAIKHSELDIKSILQAVGQGAKLSLALAEAFRMINDGSAKVANLDERHIISIDRTTSGTSLGSHQVIETEIDERSLRLTEIDLSKVILLNVLRDGEREIDGEERMRRIKATGHIRLDAFIMRDILKDPKCIPASWEKYCVTFDGTIFESSVLWWLRGKYGEWSSCVSCLDERRYSSKYLAAVLPE